MIPTLSQVCSLNSRFEADIEEYSAGHCRSIELWFTKLENYLESHSVADVQRLLDENQVTATVASYQGGLLDSQGDKRKAAWDLFEQRLDLCSELKIHTIVVAFDLQSPLTQDAIDRTRESLKLVAQTAGKRGHRIAMEFQARAAFANNVQTAVALVEEVESPHLGICFDLFQFFLGPSKFTDLALLTKRNLFHVQLSDLADVARELATDSDRILPGDGDFEIEPLLAHLRAIEYQNTVSIELMNPRIWQIAPRQFGEIAMTALRSQLGLASN